MRNDVVERTIAVPGMQDPHKVESTETWDWLEKYSRIDTLSILACYSTISISGLSTSFHKETSLLFPKGIICVSNNDHNRPIYVNYEILCNVLSTNMINFSQCEIVKVKSTEMKPK